MSLSSGRNLKEYFLTPRFSMSAGREGEGGVTPPPSTQQKRLRAGEQHVLCGSKENIQ